MRRTANHGAMRTQSRLLLGLVLSLCLSSVAFGANVNVTGTVFEDVNYAGGAGRNLANATGNSPRQSARVEAYLASTGAFLSSTTTNASGVFTLSLAQSAVYKLRVVSGTVTSSRGTGLPVQTFRTENGVDVLDHVGGEDPTKVDAGNNNGTFGSIAPIAQSVATVTVGLVAVAGVDFGFNFSTIVNTNNTGQGSLRQFIVNANALTGADTTIFMITDGNAHPGLRAGLTNQLNGSGVAVITPTTAYPQITGANTTLDATSQATNIGNTNAALLGAGGTVGVDGLALQRLNGPEVQLTGSTAIPVGFDIRANSVTVRGFSIWGFGNGANSDTNANILIGSGFSGTLIEKNVLGSAATSFTDPGATRTNADNIRTVGGTNGTIQYNLIGFANGKGIGMESTSTGWTVIGNEIRSNGLNGNTNLDGIDIENSGSDTVTGNLFVGGQGTGVDMYQSSGGNTVTNNTVQGNGQGAAGGSLENMGIRVYGSGNRIDRNIVTGNAGSGVVVTSGATSSTITKNSIFLNGAGGNGIGIDLQNSTDNVSIGTSPYVSLNDSGDADAGGNGILNFPVLTSASYFAGVLTVNGFARPGSIIEIYIADSGSGVFGQGKTFLASVTEGSAQDLDAGTGTYSGVINGVNQGTDTTNRFTFNISVGGAAATGVVLTATATSSTGETSEFSGNVTVGQGNVSITGSVYEDLNHNASQDNGESWSAGASVFVNLVQAGAVVQTRTVAAGTGAFSFNPVTPGAYTLVITNTAVATTAVAPAGWMLMNPSNGVVSVTVIAAPLVNQNFGLFHGSKLSGKVFKDTGIGGGTANDGVFNGGELGIGNTIVKATDNAGATTYDSASTDGSGNYTVWIPSAATTVKIVETNPSNYVATGGSAGTTGGAYARATLTVSFTSAGGNSYTGVNFAEVPQNNFNTDGADSALPGAVVFYPHSFTAGTGGQVTFSTAHVSTPAAAAFNEVIYQDTNCNGLIDAGEPVITAAITVIADQQICLLDKEFVAAGTPANARNSVTVTAQFTYTNAAPALSATYTHTDITTVGAGASAGLRLEKIVDKATALPGDILTYTLTYVNESSSALGSLVISDSTPAYTTFSSAACGALPTGITACNIAQPGAGGTGAVSWTFVGTLGSGATGTVTMLVKVNP